MLKSNCTGWKLKSSRSNTKYELTNITSSESPQSTSRTTGLLDFRDCECFGKKSVVGCHALLWIYLTVVSWSLKAASETYKHFSDRWRTSKIWGRYWFLEALFSKPFLRTVRGLPPSTLSTTSWNRLSLLLLLTLPVTSSLWNQALCILSTKGVYVS